MKHPFIFTLVLLVFFSESSLVTAQDFTSSNLPILVIDTKGLTIPNEPKITAHMGMIYNGPGQRNHLSDPFNEYDSVIGIELRGNSTQSFEKKPYSIETRNDDGTDFQISFMGLPPESDWILSASYLDKTLLRDPLAYEMSRRMGRWASRTIHCELVLNGAYMGVYILTEKVKRDKNRVDVARLTAADNSGSDLSGGYIYEIAQDGPGFELRRRFVYPSNEEITSQQTSYIRKYDDGFRNIMKTATYADPSVGYAAWIDVDSFVDEILLQEACKNSDAYGWSSYFHKDRNKKLEAGPAWDFDQAFSNSTFNNGPNYSEWIIEKSANDEWLAENYPEFWIRLFQEKNFKRMLRRRWDELRQDLWKTENLFLMIDSMAVVLNEAQERNFQRWNILGQPIWRSTPGVEQRNTYQKEVDYLKAFISNRMSWMDSKLLPFVTSNEDPELNSITLSNHPNPFNRTTNIVYSLARPDFVKLVILDVYGRTIRSLVDEYKTDINQTLTFMDETLPPGIFICKLHVHGKTLTRKMIIKR